MNTISARTATKIYCTLTTWEFTYGEQVKKSSETSKKKLE